MFNNGEVANFLMMYQVYICIHNLYLTETYKSKVNHINS